MHRAAVDCMLKIYAAALCEIPGASELQVKLPEEWLKTWKKRHPNLTKDAAVRTSLGGLWLLFLSGARGRLCYDPNGRPYLEGGAVDFSITHTEDHVFCAALIEAEGERIGLDAEPLDRADTWNFAALSARWFSSSERDAFDREPTAERFLSIWTRKEAAVKQSGEGLQALAKTDTVMLEKDGKLSFFAYRVQNHVLTLAIDGASHAVPDTDITWCTKEF